MAVTPANIREIITSSLTDDEILNYINIATSILSNFSCLDSYNETTMDNITKYLTAHLMYVSSSEYSKKRERIDTAEDEYFQNTNVAPVADWGVLGLTKYGMQIKLFDYNNCLVDLGKNKITPVFCNI